MGCPYTACGPDSGMSNPIVQWDLGRPCGACPNHPAAAALARAIDRSGRRKVWRGRGCRHLRPGWEVQRGVLVEDLCFQPAQVGRWIDPKLLDERRPGTVKGAERIALPSRAIESHDQVAPEPLPQWVLGRESLQQGDRFAVATQLDIGLDAVLESSQAQLLEARDRRAQRVIVG